MSRLLPRRNSSKAEMVTIKNPDGSGMPVV